MALIRKRYIPAGVLAGLIVSLALAGVFSPRPAVSGAAVLTVSARASGSFLSAVPYGPDAALARGKFLVADRRIRDSFFSQAVILLVSYGPNGAMGLIINHPTNVELSSVLPGIKGMKSRGNRVYIGGPVGVDEMFLLVRSASIPGKSLNVFGDVYMSMSRETLEGIIAKKDAGESFRVYAGYAGWTAGQLEREVTRGDWHVLNADAKTVFEKKPEAIWPKLIERASAQWVKMRNSGIRFL
jgi:putative transcriptional regulator